MIPLPLMISRWLPETAFAWRQKWLCPEHQLKHVVLMSFRLRHVDYNPEFLREDILALRVLRALKGGRR